MMDEKKQIVFMLDAHMKKFDELSKAALRGIPQYNQKVYAELLKQEGRIVTALIAKL